MDGDGHLRVSQKGYASLEITTELADLPLLRYIQSTLGGGSIKRRSGAKAYSYRLHNTPGMMELVHCINGRIRNSRRLPQLYRVCAALGVEPQPPGVLTAQSAWFAGFFDADGGIYLDKRDGKPFQISVKVTSSFRVDVEPFQVFFGGSIYYSRAGNGSFQWVVQSREGVLRMLQYFRSIPFRSQKAKRFFLVEEYYSLRKLRAYRHDSPHAGIWELHLRKWGEGLMI